MRQWKTKPNNTRLMFCIFTSIYQLPESVRLLGCGFRSGSLVAMIEQKMGALFQSITQSVQLCNSFGIDILTRTRGAQDGSAQNCTSVIQQIR